VTLTFNVRYYVLKLLVWRRALSKKQLPTLLDRHWTEYVLAIGAVVISGISLWIAIDTEDTNRKLVAAASWPYVQMFDSTHGSGGQLELSLNIGNAGVGPAKIETFELFWNGKPYRSSEDLLKNCCGYERSPAQPDSYTAPTSLLGTSVPTGVLRPGSTVPIIKYPLTPTNVATWHAFSSQREKISYRVCYCSVFNECWLSDGRELNPPRVKMCQKPQVAYTE
jgi:hypothetical protein